MSDRQEISIDASTIPSAVLRRLIEEVRYEKANNINAYNRTHNRHNRSGSGGYGHIHPRPQPAPEPTPTTEEPQP